MNRLAIATLAERDAGLVHLPGAYTAPITSAALTAAVSALPDTLKRSLTWDKGTEMTDHAQLTAATDLDAFSADPHTPWQRGSNEDNTGLIRQYSPKTTNPAVHTTHRLAKAQAALNA